MAWPSSGRLSTTMNGMTSDATRWKTARSHSVSTLTPSRRRRTASPLAATSRPGSSRVQGVSMLGESTGATNWLCRMYAVPDSPFCITVTCSSSSTAATTLARSKAVRAVSRSCPGRCFSNFYPACAGE